MAPTYRRAFPIYEAVRTAHLTLSPPILLEKKWLRPTAPMMAKYGMTLAAR